MINICERLLKVREQEIHDQVSAEKVVGKVKGMLVDRVGLRSSKMQWESQ